MKIEEKIKKLLKVHLEKNNRELLSQKYPFFKDHIMQSRILIRKAKDSLNFGIQYQKKTQFYDKVLARHQSLLLRKLGNSDIQLQVNKIKNLKIACEKLNGIIIKPGKIFSLWKIIGKPTYKDGYVDGMLLANGQVKTGLGGGLCQLSNFLFWIFMHTPTDIIERYHHSLDVFPDSGRTLPFGSGATIMYNNIDLKLKNVFDSDLQLKIWLTDKHLKGQILSNQRNNFKYHLEQKNHFFIKHNNKYYRFNEIWRIKKINGKIVSEKQIITNLAPILYKIQDNYFINNNYQVLEI